MRSCVVSLLLSCLTQNTSFKIRILISLKLLFYWRKHVPLTVLLINFIFLNLHFILVISDFFFLNVSVALISIEMVMVAGR